MPKFKIRHLTRYLYDQPVRDSANQIMLYPIKDAYQEVLHQHIIISETPDVAMHRDYFNNEIGTFTHTHPHSELKIDSRLEVITHERMLPKDEQSADEQWQSLGALRSLIQFNDFLRQEQFGALQELKQVIEEERLQRHTPLQTATNFTAYVFNNFKYQQGVTTVETTLDEIWKLHSGVCQDFAHILLAMLRIVRIPARYVSGYICPNKNGMRGEGATHAWVEAYIPGFDWIGLDPTNNCIVQDAHVRLAVGRNFPDCSPVKGTFRGLADSTLEVTVSVEYEGDRMVTQSQDALPVVPAQSTTSNAINSFRRFQEMQQQQQ